MVVSIGWVITCAVVVAGALLLPRWELAGRLAFLLRVLVPSWRFFEATGAVPYLEVRVREKEKDWSDWVRALESPAVNVLSLFSNAPGNLAFMNQSLVAQVVSELEMLDAADDLARTGSYQVLMSLAREECARLFARLDAERSSAAAEFQFRLVEVDSSGGVEERLISPVCMLGRRHEGTVS